VVNILFATLITSKILNSSSIFFWSPRIKTKHVRDVISKITFRWSVLHHILVLNKHQHSPIARKVFSDGLLNDLTESMVSELMSYNLSMAKIINQLSLSKTTKKYAILELTLLSSSMDYYERRLICELIIWN
jgi:hypothetical protein